MPSWRLNTYRLILSLMIMIEASIIPAYFNDNFSSISVISLYISVYQEDQESIPFLLAWENIANGLRLYREQVQSRDDYQQQL